MLQNIREKTSGWIAYAIIGLISIPFVLAGITSYFGGGDQAPAAIVDGEEISSRQLDYAYANYSQRLRSIFGGQLPAAFNNEAVLKNQVRDQLIDEQVLSQYVDNQNFRLGNQSLNQKITSMKIFHQDGRFSQETYKAQLSSQGLSPQQFEEDLRRSEEMAQIRWAINTTKISSKQREDELQALATQQRKVRSLTLPIDIASVEVTQADLEKEYNSNSSRYMTTEKVRIDYIELNIETIKAKINPTEDDLIGYFEQVKDDLTPTEIRMASHILLNVAEDASSSEADAQKKLAVELKQQISNGASFEALAKKHSEDPGSASDGGDLGEVEKGMMVEPFEDVLFALNAGDVSEPVRTSFGWHIIKLNEINGGDAPTYESKRAELAELFKAEKAESRIYELAESLSNITYEQTDSLVPASEQLELTIKTSDWFERNTGMGVALNEKVRNLAFSNDVLNQGRNSETLELSDNNMLVLRLNEHQPAALPALNDIKTTLEKSVKVQKARYINAETGKKALQQVKGGTSLNNIAFDWTQNIKDSGFIKRDSTVDNRDIVSLAFKMKKPMGSSEFQGLEMASGDYVIVEVSDIKTEPAAVKDDAKAPAQQSEASYEYQAWLKDKVSQSKVIKTPLAELN